MNQQLSLASIYDPSLPLECSGTELGDTIEDIERAGFTVRRMDVVGAAGYRLHLQRASSTGTAPGQGDEDALVAWLLAVDLEAFSLR